MSRSILTFTHIEYHIHVFTGSQIMTSISEMIIRNQLSRETVQQAEQWAMKGLEVVIATRKASKEPIAICEVAYAVQLFNMASLRAVSSS